MIPATVTLKGIWAALIALAFAVLVGLLAVQTVRLEGFKIWPVSVEGYIAKSERFKTDLKACKDGQGAAERRQAEAMAAKEAEYGRLAERIDSDEQQIKSLSRALTDSYAAAHRVRPETAGGSPGEPGPAAEGEGAGISEAVPDDALVAVSAADLQTCSDNSIYALKAHEWAVGLNENEGK